MSTGITCVLGVTDSLVPSSVPDTETFIQCMTQYMLRETLPTSAHPMLLVSKYLEQARDRYHGRENCMGRYLDRSQFLY